MHRKSNQSVPIRIFKYILEIALFLGILRFLEVQEQKDVYVKSWMDGLIGSGTLERLTLQFTDVVMFTSFILTLLMIRKHRKLPVKRPVFWTLQSCMIEAMVLHMDPAIVTYFIS